MCCRLRSHAPATVNRMAAMAACMGQSPLRPASISRQIRRPAPWMEGRPPPAATTSMVGSRSFTMPADASSAVPAARRHPITSPSRTWKRPARRISERVAGVFRVASVLTMDTARSAVAGGSKRLSAARGVGLRGGAASSAAGGSRGAGGSEAASTPRGRAPGQGSAPMGSLIEW